MHEMVEGLHGVEVVADDFAVAGYGDTTEKAIVNHNNNLHCFLKWCQEMGVRLNADKMQLKQAEAPFIGQITSGEGFRVDHAKVK